MASLTYEQLKSKSMDLTGFYETSSTAPACYGVASGNHDGMGISFGILQWNFGQSTLQPIFNYMIDNYPEVTKTAFGFSTDPQYYNTFVDVVKNRTVANQIAWGDSISNQSNKHLLIAPWSTYFMNLGVTAECQAKEISSAQSYFTQGEVLYNTIKGMSPAPAMYSRRFYALCFDIAVQCWTLNRTQNSVQVYDGFSALQTAFNAISTAGKTAEQIETEKMVAIVEVLADGYLALTPANQSSHDLVRLRKMITANGSGDYYGTAVNLTNYDLNFEPAFPTYVIPHYPKKYKDEHITGTWTFDNPVTVAGQVALTAGDFGTTAGKVSEGNHTHSTYIDTSDIAVLSKGAKISSKRYYVNGGTETYVKLGMVSMNGTYQRAYFQMDIQVGGTQNACGTLDCYLYHSTAYNVVHTSTYMTVNTPTGKRPFPAGDIVVVKKDTGTAYTYEFYIRLTASASLNVNMPMISTESAGVTYLPTTVETSATLPVGAINVEILTLDHHTHTNKTVLDSVTNTGDGSLYLANDGTYKAPVNSTLYYNKTEVGSLLSPLQTASHTHSNKTLLDSLVSNGAGTSFLANDGTYKAVSGSGDTVNANNENITGLWDFNNGIYIRHKKIGYNGVASTDKWMRLIRVKFTSTYTRFYAEIPILHSGTYIKLGTLKILLYEAVLGTVHSSSWVNVINDSGSTMVFASGDVAYQQWKTSGLNPDYVDIWVKMREYSRLAHNINFLYTEGTTYVINPDNATSVDGVGLQTAIPSAGATSTYDGNAVTAVASVNATIKTITMT